MRQDLADGLLHPSYDGLRPTSGRIRRSSSRRLGKCLCFAATGPVNYLLSQTNVPAVVYCGKCALDDVYAHVNGETAPVLAASDHAWRQFGGPIWYLHGPA